MLFRLAFLSQENLDFQFMHEIFIGKIFIYSILNYFDYLIVIILFEYFMTVRLRLLKPFLSIFIYQTNAS